MEAGFNYDFSSTLFIGYRTTLHPHNQLLSCCWWGCISKVDMSRPCPPEPNILHGSLIMNFGHQKHDKACVGGHVVGCYPINHRTEILLDRLIQCPKIFQFYLRQNHSRKNKPISFFYRFYIEKLLVLTPIHTMFVQVNWWNKYLYSV